MRFATLDEWLNWQETLHPAAMDLELQRSSAVAAELGLLESSFRILTVAGTNGKGSVVAVAQALLSAAGLSVGSYTSPHLIRYNERICVDGESVSDAGLIAAFAAVDAAREGITLTYFEFGTLAAMWLFMRRRVDVAILEVGIGGRLDTVNLFDCDVAVVTSVAIDHTDWLGSDRETIGSEKAGILRAGKPLICGESDPPDSVLQRARDLGCPVYRRGRDFDFAYDEDAWRWTGGGYDIPALPRVNLAGEYQQENAAAAAMAVLALGLRGDWPTAMRVGLETAVLAGRYQEIRRCPQCIVDVAHNVAAAQQLVRSLRANGAPRRTFGVFSALADKDIRGLVETMAPVIDEWYVASLPVARAAHVAHLARTIGFACGKSAQLCESVTAGYDAALSVAEPQDRIVIFGSFYTVGLVLQAATREQKAESWKNV